MDRSSLADWTPEQITRGRQWVQAWRDAGPRLEQIRRDELRRLDGYQAISHLCAPADFHQPPRVARPTSGLVDQQRWFMKARPRD
jgi:hypothetical protein